MLVGIEGKDEIGMSRDSDVMLLGIEWKEVIREIVDGNEWG